MFADNHVDLHVSGGNWPPLKPLCIRRGRESEREFAKKLFKSLIRQCSDEISNKGETRDFSQTLSHPFLFHLHPLSDHLSHSHLPSGEKEISPWKFQLSKRWSDQSEIEIFDFKASVQSFNPIRSILCTFDTLIM